MQTDVSVSFRQPHQQAGTDVVAEVVFLIRFVDGDLAGLELELHGTRIRKGRGDGLFITWPSRPSERAESRRYWSYIRGDGEAEARERLVRAFESWRKSG